MKLHVMSSVDVLVLRFDGKRLEAMGLNLVWDAISGPYKRGAAPKGEYVVEKPTKIEDVPANKAFKDKAGNVWFAKLKPMFETDRTGFGIHPDGNVPGTMGCVGLKARDTSDVFALLQGSPNTVLYIV